MATVAFFVFLLQVVFTTTTASFNYVPEVLEDDAKLWAVLVAGSNNYENYRHQADICHAYHVLHAHGIPDEQIIVMMYDDIARNPANPTKGVLINHPNGTNVYQGVLKDYTQDDVTPENFLNVLLGDKEAMRDIGSGKVLESGPNDHVFINFADHGAPGILAFPNDELHVGDFQKTLRKMHQNNMYKKLVIYVEACESGSMFEHVLPNNTDIYAATAANSKESSYACYFDAYRGTYLGDVFSVNWMEDSDVENLNQEKIKKQIQIVTKETKGSHVMHYGNLTIADLTVGQFQGLNGHQGQPLPKVAQDAVPSPEVPLAILQMKLKMASTSNSDDFVNIHKKILKLKQNRAFLNNAVDEIIKKTVSIPEQLNYVKTAHLNLKDLQCYETVARHFSENCFALSKNDYALRKMYIFVNLCEMGIKTKTTIKAMDLICTHPPVYGIY